MIKTHVSYLSQSFDDVETDFFVKVLEALGPLEIAGHAVLVVRPQAVIPASLNVDAATVVWVLTISSVV